MLIFHHKLKNIQQVLAKWSKEVYGNIFQKIATLEEVIQTGEMQFELDPSQGNKQSLHKAQADLSTYLHLEEEYWRQKAGMSWFVDGERNTKCFPAYINSRMKRLQLNIIKNYNDDQIEDSNGMATEAVKFFQKQINEDCFPDNFDILKHKPTKITMAQNEVLKKIPEEEDVKVDVYALKRESASGPDGFTGVFSSLVGIL